MGKRLWLFLTICLCTVSMAFAQNKVTGVVIEEETGEPVIGASVKVKGFETIGAATDINGRFTLADVPASAKTLVISYIGMQTKEINVKPNVKVFLSSESRNLKEQFVVAYGTATKESFTGSAKVIGADMIAETQKSNALDALTGKVAGVQITNASGQPGRTTPTIIIRGISSISASNSPLIIVDGAPFDGDMNTINPADIESMTPLKDAASNALYGARGAAGVILITTKKAKRGEGAKIVVDAKWGANSRATRRYKTIDNPALYYETYYNALKNSKLATGMSEADAHTWAVNNLISGSNGLQYDVYSVPEGQSLIGTNGKLNPNATMGNVVNGNYLQADNWLDEVFRSGLRQEYNVTASSATDKITFYSNFNYLNNKGITVNSDYERINGRLKADAQLTSWFKLGVNFNYSRYHANQLGEDGSSNSSGNLWAVATTMAPIYPMYVRDANGNIMIDAHGYTVYDYGDKSNAGLERPVFGLSNPYGANILDVNKVGGNAFSASVNTEIRFLNDFKFVTNSSFDLNDYFSTSMTNAYYGSYSSQNGILSLGANNRYSFNVLQQLDWAHEFNDHNISVMAAHEFYRRNTQFVSGTKHGMALPTSFSFATTISDDSPSGYPTEYSTEGLLSRVLYDYQQKYFLSGSLRYDGSSHLASKRRWGSFWSVGGAWLLSKESFFEDLDLDWVNMLKIKASYGQQGNDGIGALRYVNLYNVINYENHTAAIPTSTMANEDLEWEKQGNFNAGVEFELFDNRLSGSVEFFYRKVSDMLYSVALPKSFGYVNQYCNVGDMRNRGIELDLNYDIIRGKDLLWSVDFNATHYTNKILRLPKERKSLTVDGYVGYPSGNQFFAEGLSIYTFYTYQYAGVYNKNNYVGDATDAAASYNKVADYDASFEGRPMWYTLKEVTVKDANGDPVLDGNKKAVTKTVKVKTTDYSSAEQFLCGNALPKVYGGFGTSVKWKNFDISANFSFSLGGKVYDSDYQSMMANPRASYRGYSMHADLLDAWSSTNTGSDIPALLYGEQYANASSDRWLTNASYLSLNNFNVGYTLPRRITRLATIDKVRFYVSGDNLFVVSARQGLDPRQTISGTDANNTYYPPIRTISGGVTITF